MAVGRKRGAALGCSLELVAVDEDEEAVRVDEVPPRFLLRRRAAAWALSGMADRCACSCEWCACSSPSSERAS